MTLLFGFAAVNTGNNLLFMIVSALLGFMAVSGLFGWANIRNLEIALGIPDEIYHGRETIITLRVLNKKTFIPSFLLRLSILDTTSSTRHIPAGCEKATTIPVTFPQRGIASIHSCIIASPFPVNFFVRRVEAALVAEITVFPAPLATGKAADFPQSGKDGLSLLARTGYEGEIAKIVEYSGKDPMKNIHWRLSARHDDFKVKQLSAVSADPVIIDPDILPGANLEERLSRSAYLVNSLIRNNRPVGLKTGVKTISPALDRAHRLRLLRELALYVSN